MARTMSNKTIYLFMVPTFLIKLVRQ
ncbi:hypothetical protein PENARI_c002G09426 [Penicillium arizonense]|uniref:Uncharacterized protein n=1 Tax=Penicillium arizonense TaxID=1835702 RepID=A0A1F5LWE0_PENAI|nr:hypothetical protein PENARI_c002G09426 [Penicillium arizonense]